MIDEVLVFLDGKPDEVVRRVQRAHGAGGGVARLRARGASCATRCAHLERMEEPTVVLEVEGGDRDVVGYARDGDDACVALMRIRGGKLLARDHRFVENIDGEEDADVLEAFLARQRTALLDERAQRAARAVRLRGPRGRSRSRSSARACTCRSAARAAQLVDLAQQNARHLLEEFRLAAIEARRARRRSRVRAAARARAAAACRARFVCFDISHAQGTDTVASCVWFENGRPKRAEYRKFKVKTVEGIDDFASMREVVGRYFQRRLEEEKPLPDLVVIDGGKGQLNAAHEALRRARPRRDCR